MRIIALSAIAGIGFGLIFVMPFYLIQTYTSPLHRAHQLNFTRPSPPLAPLPLVKAEPPPPPG
jgi:hypothetical protein